MCSYIYIPKHLHGSNFSKIGQKCNFIRYKRLLIKPLLLYNTNMKIGLVVDDTLDKPDGVQQYVLGLGNWLDRQGHEVHYICGQTQRTDLANVHSISRNVSVKFNGNRMSTPLPASKKIIQQLLQDLQLDIIHVQSPHSPFMAQRVIMAAPQQTPVVATFHILPHSRSVVWGTQLLAWLLRPSLRRIDTMFAVSESAQQFVRQTFKLEAPVVPNHVNLGQFDAAKGFERFADKLTIVYLNRLVPRKGAMHLVEAICYIRDNKLYQEPYQVVICGKGEETPKLQRYISEHNLEDLITLEGFVSEADKPRYLASSDLAVYPSTGGESFGIVLLEGMAASKGVVLAGNNPGYACVMQPHPEQLVEPKDTAAFASKLVHYLSDSTAREAARQWQRQDVKQYDVNIVGGKLLQAYNTLITGKKIL
jgi:phosphatidyl-myo-inositol alpha-mannosyltransferase